MGPELLPFPQAPGGLLMPLPLPHPISHTESKEVDTAGCFHSSSHLNLTTSGSGDYYIKLTDGETEAQGGHSQSPSKWVEEPGSNLSLPDSKT